MHSLWVSLKESSVSCTSCKLSAMVVLPHKNFINSTYDDRPTMDKKNKKMVPPTLEPNYLTTLFYELNVGDQSRNVIEIIFLAALSNPSRQRKINHVLKIINQIEVHKMFEEYRATVKTNALQHKKHPRSSVDGNELLRFYGTTMTCCNRKNNSSFSNCCNDPSCGVCRLISYNFDSDRIHLSTNSDTMTDERNAGNLKGKRGRMVKRAVVLCRIIAGEVASGPSSSLETLVFRNLKGLLPCFVIVFT